MSPGRGFRGLLAPASRDLDDGATDAAGAGEGWCAEGSVAVALAGDLVNRAALARELGCDPGAEPAQVLLRAWQRWGERCTERLDGVLALAARDGGRLTLYRDPSGLQNLFFHVRPDGAACAASHLPALLSLPGVPRRLSRPALHEFLRFLDISAPRTVYADVWAVPAGCRVRIERGRAGTPELARRSPPPRPPSFEAAVSALDEALSAAVAKRLEGHEHPAAFLSGGIDSALLCAMAARQRRDLVALTVGFDGPAHDESAVARGIASALGIAHEVMRFDHAVTLQAFDRLARSLEQPLADPSTASTVLAFERAAGRFDVMLDGTGADEAVGAMPPRHLRLTAGPASLLPRAVRQALATTLRLSPRTAGYARIVDFEHPAETMIRWHGFARAEVEALCGEPVSFDGTAFYRTYARFPRGAHFERYSALVEAMPCERLNQALCATGAVVRFPFCAPDVDGLIRQLDTDWRSAQGQPKRILRSLLARYLPRTLWDLPKHGFDFPLHDFLAAEDFALVRRHLDPARLEPLLGNGAREVAVWATRLREGDRRVTFRVWALVVLAAWLEHHDIEG